MIGLVKKILHLLEPRERKQALWVLTSTIVMAFMEIVGIASILPFMAVLSSPDIVQKNKYLRQSYDFFGFESVNDYLFFLGLMVFALLVISNTIKAWNRWTTLGFSTMTGHGISSRLYQQYLYQPYAFFLNHNSSELRKNVLSEIQTLVLNIISPVMDVIARSLVACAILLLLVVVNPFLALTTGLFLGGAYFMIYWSMRRWLLRIGQLRVAAQSSRHKIVNESVLDIKNVKLTGNEDTYIKLYEPLSFSHSKTSVLSGLASDLPSYILEVVAFGGILFLSLYQLMQHGLSQALPLVTLYAFAGYRLMPSFRAIFSAYTKIRFNYPTLEKITAELHATELDTLQRHELNNDALPFKNIIELKNISFSYEQNQKTIFHDFNLTIPANSSVGIIGKTGSGKTTLVDLILGLLSPSGGQILVDGQAVTDANRKAWQKNTAYVTQHIYLTDDTVRKNIAFGLADGQIDDEKVKHAAKMAALDEFIENDLPAQYETIIGENGIRLSGGQRQRIGLARALYLDRPILVLDEATSSLDHETEAEVMQAITNIGRQKTIIMIAHRTHSLAHADQIIDLNNFKHPENLEAA